MKNLRNYLFKAYYLLTSSTPRHKGLKTMHENNKTII